MFRLAPINGLSRLQINVNLFELRFFFSIKISTLVQKFTSCRTFCFVLIDQCYDVCGCAGANVGIPYNMRILNEFSLKKWQKFTGIKQFKSKRFSTQLFVSISGVS